MPRPDNGTGPGVLVLGIGPKKVGSVYDVGMHGRGQHYQFPVVFLGLFLDLL